MVGHEPGHDWWRHPTPGRPCQDHEVCRCRRASHQLWLERTERRRCGGQLHVDRVVCGRVNGYMNRKFTLFRHYLTQRSHFKNTPVVPTVVSKSESDPCLRGDLLSWGAANSAITSSLDPILGVLASHFKRIFIKDFKFLFGRRLSLTNLVSAKIFLF